MKRLFSLIVVAALLLSLSVVSGSNTNGFGIITEAEEISYLPEVVDLTTRDDFGFGINVHDPHHSSAYPAKYLENQVHAVAKAGSTWIRINGGIPSDGDWTYQDTLIGLCNKYGLKVQMVIQPSRRVSLDYITLYCETLATRYNGEEGRGLVDIFQVWNELDNRLMSAKYGNAVPNGMLESHYFTIPVAGNDNDLPEFLEYWTAAEKGIHCEGSKSQFMINFAWHHYGAVHYMLRNGLKVDVVGNNLYSEITDREESAKDMEEYLDSLEKDIANKFNVPVIITETGASARTHTDEEKKNPNEITHQRSIDLMYQYYNRPWIKAAIFYELLDQKAPNDPGSSSSDVWYYEYYFGLIQCGDGTEPGNGILDSKYEKWVYKEIQRLLKGDPDLPMITKSEIDLTPYEKFVVDTADDSNIGKEDNSSDATVSIPEIDWGTDTETENKPIDTESNIENTLVTEPEKQIEEVIVENVITPVKDAKSRETVYEIPWGFVIGVGAGIIVLAAGVIVAYILITKKKFKK